MKYLILLSLMLTACGSDSDLCPVPKGRTGTDEIAGVWYAPCDYSAED